QLADNAFVVALHRRGDGINLFLHFLIVHNTRIRGGRVHCGSGAGNFYGRGHSALRTPDAVPHLLLIFRGHRLAAHDGRGAKTASGAAEAVLTVRRHPTSGLDAEDTEVDRIALAGHDAIFADDAVLLAASNYLAGEEEQRSFRVIDQDQSIHLRAAHGMDNCRFAGAVTDEATRLPSFSHDNVAAAAALIK